MDCYDNISAMVAIHDMRRSGWRRKWGQTSTRKDNTAAVKIVCGVFGKQKNAELGTVKVQSGDLLAEL